MTDVFTATKLGSRMWSMTPGQREAAIQRLVANMCAMAQAQGLELTEEVGKLLPFTHEADLMGRNLPRPGSSHCCDKIKERSYTILASADVLSWTFACLRRARLPSKLRLP